MTSLPVLGFVSSLFLLYTFLAVVGRCLRGGATASIDIALYLALLLVTLALPATAALPQPLEHALRAGLPLAGVLIVRHFRPVPSSLPLVGWIIPSGLVVAAAVWGLQVLNVTRWAVPTYLVSGLAVVAGFLAYYARQSRGVHRRRVGFAALGTVAFLFVMAVTSFAPFVPLEARRALYLATSVGTSLAFISYFFAFAPPRRLIARWRNVEHASHVSATLEHEPEERGRLAADQLLDGVRSCIGPIVAVVARPRETGSGELVVTASTEPSLLGSVISSDDAVVADTYRNLVPSRAALKDIRSEFAAVLRRFGRTLLVAPMDANSHCWGIVATVHRRGPLFPEDDLTMLGQLGRSAATALEHAQLIVERRQQARKQADAQLRELESRVELMLASIKDYAMLVLDQNGTVASWHVGAQEVFGYTREQITRESAASLFDMDAAEFDAWLAEASARGKAEREGACRRPDGRRFIGITTIRPLVVEAGSPPGFVVVTRDITERRNLEERLHHGQKMQAIGQLAGGIAHDFNNLLTAVVGYADWLERDLADDPRAEQVREIQRAAERAADLTRQLLAFSRRQVIQATSLDLTGLIQSLLPMLRRLIGGRIEIVDATSALPAPILGDRSQIEQVVVNLVLNARDAMPNGGRVTIRTSDVELEGDIERGGHGRAHVLLEVTDTGIGMDAETRRRAFEPFFTTREVGTGLGLATVYGIVQQMGGLIEVDSEVNCGTTFRVYLPYSSEPVAQAEPPQAQSVVTGRETLLLIEDDDALRTYLVHVLEAHGYHVIPAEGAEAALTVTDEELRTLDLIISDVVMPGMTGPEVVAELCHMRPGLPALFISGGELTEQESRDTPAPGPLLQKPFSSTDLLTKVRELLSVA